MADIWIVVGTLLYLIMGLGTSYLVEEAIVLATQPPKLLIIVLWPIVLIISALKT